MFIVYFMRVMRYCTYYEVSLHAYFGGFGWGNSVMIGQSGVLFDNV
ncbi:hypothetical protein EPHNCH_0408 [Anaplasma phagocytophilum str. NCH-1]|uniref:Uncharacterized protein n=2 Tax=Anaplasma phagocytophilum TaxID=948 RepID=A0A0F3NP00_ANAPH|nr:hypothetical protein EPHNCH_0408 [Anaplasma phagocytophilum str. NCH-1]